jgi:hemerythrin superfamily protein
VSEEEEEAAEEGVILPKDEETGDEEELDEAMQLCMKNMKQCERMVVAGFGGRRDTHQPTTARVNNNRRLQHLGFSYPSCFCRNERTP